MDPKPHLIAYAQNDEDIVPFVQGDAVTLALVHRAVIIVAEATVARIWWAVPMHRGT